MSSKSHALRLWVCLMVLGLVAALPGFAGSAVIGSVAGSMNATVGGQTLFPNTTLYSGDSLQVRDGVAVIALGSSSRMIFGHDTMASFLRDSNEVTVLLGRGDVSMFQGQSGNPVRVKIGGVSVVPVSGFKTLGEVAMLNGTVVVTAKEGTLRVQGNGQTVNVANGKSLTIFPGSNAPQGAAGPAGGSHIAGATLWGISDAVIGGVGLILGGIALSRADNAKDDAASAAAAGQAAASAAAAAASAAAAAASEANLLGCALDALANKEGLASPYTPPSGYTCPAS